MRTSSLNSPLSLRRRVWAVLLALAVLAAACGSDDDEPSAASSSTTDTSTTVVAEEEAPPPEPEPEAPQEADDTTTTEPATEDTLDDDTTEIEATADPAPVLASWPTPYQDFIAEHGGSRFVEAAGYDMHYIETGDPAGPTVLLVHGLPMHTYLWRDVIPELDDYRVIALDLPGFGRSSSVEAGTVPADLATALDAFIEALELVDVHLVVHDLGGLAGLGYAAERSDRLASITMFETLWTTLGDFAAIPGPFGQTLPVLQTDEGPVLMVEQNLMVESIPALTSTGVDQAVHDVYRFPFLDEDRRLPLLDLGPRSFPVDSNQPATEFVAGIEAFLTASELPKLVIDVSPGLLSDAVAGGVRQPDFAAATFPNTQLVALDGAGHFVQEDVPVELGQIISSFLDGVGAAA